jgi:Tfp pilus assembly protein FimT
MFKKKENGFSLVELAVAAAIATALAVVAVTVVSGTAASVSAKGTSAASVESCTISESLAKAGGDITPINCSASSNMVLTFASGVIGTLSQNGSFVLEASTGSLRLFGMSDAQANQVIAAISTGGVTTIKVGTTNTYTIKATTVVNNWSSFYGGREIFINNLTLTSGSYLAVYKDGTAIPIVEFLK